MAGSPLTMVTGATSGIGRAIAENLSKSRDVLWSGRRPDVLVKAAGPCGKSLVLELNKPEGIEGAVRNWRQMEAAPVEALVYCAGVFHAGPLRTFSPTVTADLMRINFLSAAELCRLLAKRDINGSALKSVVLISSVSAIRGVKGYALYAATKGAMEAFARSLAVELAPTVRINLVCPGAIETERSDPSALEVAKANHPLGIGQPADVVAAVSFLLSDGARWITGQRLVVDGGWTCS